MSKWTSKFTDKLKNFNAGETVRKAIRNVEKDFMSHANKEAVYPILLMSLAANAYFDTLAQREGFKNGRNSPHFEELGQIQDKCDLLMEEATNLRQSVKRGWKNITKYGYPKVEIHQKIKSELIEPFQEMMKEYPLKDKNAEEDINRFIGMAEGEMSITDKIVNKR